jgi:hypothetical protein
MEKNYPGERWKEVIFNFDFSNPTTIKVSNFGRIKTYNKVSNGNLINGSSINGYKIIRLRFFKPRLEKVQTRLDYLEKQVRQLNLKVKGLQIALKKLNTKDLTYLSTKQEFDNTESLLKGLKESLSEKYKEDIKSRMFNYQSLIHRLVAEYFVNRPSPNHTVVAHLDYNKLNNRSTNLKWMTLSENYLHQQSSPLVIASKSYADGRRKEDASSTKLSVTKVMLLKKLLNEGKPVKQLAKQFRVTETQILRIKRGENWAEVKAAP